MAVILPLGMVSIKPWAVLRRVVGLDDGRVDDLVLDVGGRPRLRSEVLHVAHLAVEVAV